MKTFLNFVTATKIKLISNTQVKLLSTKTTNLVAKLAAVLKTKTSLNNVISVIGLKTVFAIVGMLVLTIIMLFISTDKTKVIDLNFSGIETVDDRVKGGASNSKVLRTNQGLEFTCHILKSTIEQPFCELHIDLQDLTQKSLDRGVDLSSYEQIGLWITHNHPTQPGTRIALKNFDTDSVNNSLKPNTLEYLEAYVPDPVWVKLSDFHIPQWWNNTHNLSLEHGGLNFSNIYTLVIAPRALVKEGEYKLTIERIEFKGTYLSTAVLFIILLMLWTLVIAYAIYQFYHNRKKRNEISEHITGSVAFGSMVCSLTGALNRIGLRKYFDLLAPSDVDKLSLIFIGVDRFEIIQQKYGKRISDKILRQFIDTIIETCRASDIVARWDDKDFVMVCPDTTDLQASHVIAKITSAIQLKSWPKKIEVTCSTGVAQMEGKEVNDLISRAKTSFYEAKNIYTNRHIPMK